MRRVLSVLGSACFVMAFMCGCSSADTSVEFGGTQGTSCIPAGSTDYTYGSDAIRNLSSSDVVLRSARLIHPTGATLESASIAPIADQTLLGFMPGWPPGGQATHEFRVRDDFPATLSAQSTANLLVHLRAEGEATVKAVEVTYEVDGRQRTVRNSTELRVRARC